MRFPRHAKIFRGQLDAAPLAGVFFLLLIFLLLASLLYTPGIPIQLAQTMPSQSKIISITKANEIIFENKNYKTNAFDQLRAVLKTLPAETTLVVKTDPASNPALLAQLRDVARLLDLHLGTSGAGINPPASRNMGSATGPTVVVAINAAGQFFFENQLVAQEKLKARLGAAVKESRVPLTLVVLADKTVEYDVVVRLTQLAEEAGIGQALLQIRPVSANASR